MKVTNLKQLLDGWLGSVNYDKDSRAGKLYPFFVRVGCVKMAAPRHPRFEPFIDFGSASIGKVFNQRDFGSTELTFIFPERFMSVHEQQGFMSCLKKHPKVDQIKQVDILTSCPLLISNFHREQIRILTWDDDILHNGVPV